MSGITIGIDPPRNIGLELQRGQAVVLEASEETLEATAQQPRAASIGIDPVPELEAARSDGDHRKLTGRSDEDQHPVGAITGLQAALDGKQAALVSGDTIKTVGGETLLGSGDVPIPAVPELVEDTRTTNAETLTGRASTLTELKHGTRVLFRLQYTTAASTKLNLTLANGTTTGAINVYRTDGTLVAANVGLAGCVLPLTFIKPYTSRGSTIAANGAWVLDSAYDTNSNTIGYQLRTNSSTLPASDKFVRYRLLFTSADGMKWVPANTSTSTNATTARSLNTRAIDPFGPIVYYGGTAEVAAGANPGATTLWQQYNITIGYSYVKSLSSSKPVFLKCTPQADGSAVMADLVQALPTTDDGFIYIRLGIATSSTAMELRAEHRVYYHDGTGLRIWTGVWVWS